MTGSYKSKIFALRKTRNGQYAHIVFTLRQSNTHIYCGASMVIFNIKNLASFIHSLWRMDVITAIYHQNLLVVENKGPSMVNDLFEGTLNKQCWNREIFSGILIKAFRDSPRSVVKTFLYWHIYKEELFHKRDTKQFDFCLLVITVIK